MKRLKMLTATLIVIASLLQCGCSAKPEKEKTEAWKISSFLGLDNENIIFMTDSIDELRTESEGAYSKYNAAICFLSGDFDSFSSLGNFSAETNMYEECNFPSVEISEFELVEYTDTDNGNRDSKTALYFNVTDSKCEAMPEGEYYYSIDSLVWSRLDEYEPDEKYSDAIAIVKWMADCGGISWSNGVSADENFSFAVFRTVSRYLQDKGMPVTDENLKNTVKAMFGIENYTPELYIDSEKVDFYEIENGVWKEKYDSAYVGATTAMLSVKDVRQTDEDNFEIDVQYYADAFEMIPSYKTTVYVTVTGDGDVKYSFPMAEITNQSEYKPFVFGV